VIQPSSPSPWLDWQGRALVVGHGGIGQALACQLAQRAPALEVLATCRCPASCDRSLLELDLTSDASLAALGRSLAGGPPLRIVINTAGVLHDGELQPERRLSQLRRDHLERHFALNGYGPVLLAQALEPLLPRDQPCHFASLSARVGSIGDNQLGGWYSYRSAKAAQNQLMRCLAIEWTRRLPLTCVSLLHPGTTATPLSAPFQASVPAERLFTPERAACQLIQVLEQLTPAQSGRFWAWDGQAIPW
jgi:NAD(P)-dependent dehydrogenase (short-subunit alcohol dehydrogenase family)